MQKGSGGCAVGQSFGRGVKLGDVLAAIETSRLDAFVRVTYAWCGPDSRPESWGKF